MKLEDWLLTTGKAVVAFTHWLDKAKGLSVIGTCDLCENLDTKGSPPFSNTCSIQGVVIHMNSSAKDFGCIHWKEKKK
ncbi:MAG: hypothetical protein HN472_09025 [Nitrospina sp.]|jgi:hypothetical protein|nr:hypothetical protein [Nitrospina sp.]MBT3509668.1 hypothetical protein [Nitrospina sp.]MBT3875498.1 hypothetical protein [Nitrospina sp.]MBT4047202.1 hypothetical protein [Nitrospina sp.]MBT4556973.1 hypothetical protein [Nitrospina sp.]